jgi:hypothetical protein
MIKTRFAHWALGILLSIVVFCAWWDVYANNDYGALAGAYVFDENGEKCTLYLRPDRTFEQELSRSGEIQKAQGHWHRYGQAHVSFSNEFLKLSGEDMNASGEAHGQFDKTLGIFPTLTLAPLPNGPRFHRRLFH